MKETRTTYIDLKQQGVVNSKLGDYAMLVKFKLSMMVVLSASLAYLVAAGAGFNLSVLALLSIGGFLVTGASNTLNQVLEREFDKLMTRTENRPLAANRMKVAEAVLFAGIILLIGITLLALINPISALLGTISFVAYAFVYTPLKRFSTLAVALGAIPGALPVMIGVTAFEGSITLLAVVLFGIQFLWQFPHFWSIGWLSFEDYKKAGFKLLPVDATGQIDKNIGLHSFIYAVLLIPILFIGMYYGLEIGWFTLTILMIMNLIYIAFSYRFFRNQDRKAALSLMFCSFFYLPVVLLSFMIN